MKDHFDKLLCERPRRGGISPKGRFANRDYDDMPTKESMKINHIRGWNGKELSDFLTPLYRFLNGKVGKRWDTVYSEIRQMIGKNPNAVKGHILQHLYGWQGVELHTNKVGKQRFENTQRYGSIGLRELSNGQLYIDDDGILRKYNRKGPKKKSCGQLREEKWMQTAQHLPNGNQARKINGLWFEVVLSPILESQILTTWSEPNKYTKTSYPSYQALVNDVLGMRGSPKDFEHRYKAPVYASSKRAMNSKDLKKYELKND